MKFFPTFSKFGKFDWLLCAFILILFTLFPWAVIEAEKSRSDRRVAYTISTSKATADHEMTMKGIRDDSRRRRRGWAKLMNGWDTPHGIANGLSSVITNRVFPTNNIAAYWDSQNAWTNGVIVSVNTLPIYRGTERFEEKR